MARKRKLALEGGLCRQCGAQTATITIATCPDCGGPIIGHAKSKQRRLTLLSLPPMRYQCQYAWFVLLSAMDIMLTWTILQLNGVELNPIAADVIGRLGIWGMIVFKFSLVIFVVIMSEIIGRRKDAAGKRLAEWSVALTSIPVAASLYQLLTA